MHDTFQVMMPEKELIAGSGANYCLSCVMNYKWLFTLRDPNLLSKPHIYIKATDRDICISLPEKLCLLTIKVMSNYLMECSTYTKRAALMTCNHQASGRMATFLLGHHYLPGLKHCSLSDSLKLHCLSTQASLRLTVEINDIAISCISSYTSPCTNHK